MTGGDRPLFDRYAVVDWSARAAPATGPDSIWIAELGADGTVALANPPTRHTAALALGELIERSAGDRLLIGIDVSLGYPAGTSELLGLGGPPWEATWRLVASLVDDDHRNRNNRFAVAAELNRRAGGTPGPFWGCPPAHAEPALPRTKPAVFPVGEYRHAETLLRARRMRPASVWQLLGAGSVGSQTLTALPVLAALVARHGVDVWPFTTGLAAPATRPGGTVVAEVWPTMFAPGPGQVRDAAQVAGTVTALRAADRDRRLAAWFAPPVGAAHSAITAEEGWILGLAG